MVISTHSGSRAAHDVNGQCASSCDRKTSSPNMGYKNVVDAGTSADQNIQSTREQTISKKKKNKMSLNSLATYLRGVVD